MTTIAALWWIFFWTALGLCLGSFLNVVIYRIPRGKSLRSPLWSACPACRRRIAWYDNLPIISFVLLGGRCRNCAVPIATRYVTIEAMTAVVVLMLLDAFLIGQTRAGLSTSEFGLTDRLALDWPILTAHVILFACLLGMSAIDLEHYWVDIRFTNLVAIAGFVLHTFWTPRGSMSWPRPDSATALTCIAALVGLGVLWIIRVCQPHDPEDSTKVESEPESDAPVEPRPPGRPPPSLASPPRTAGWIMTALLVALVVGLVMAAAFDMPVKHTGRALVPLGIFFLMIVSASTVQRASDHEIMDSIHEERHTARGVVLGELVTLLPAIIFGAIALWVMLSGGEISERISGALNREFHIPQTALTRSWRPLTGFSTAAAGFIIGGGVGWAVRIIFTLAFGKEAFGVGDIHLMAAAGAVAGWQVVAMGFFLTCVVAMVGWLMTLPFKRTRALPLGPWLSLSILVVVIFYRELLDWGPVERALHAARMIAGAEISK